MDSKKWITDAMQLKDEILKDVRFYISEGIEKSIALEMVLNNSTVGAGIKAQIRYEEKWSRRLCLSNGNWREHSC